LVRPCKIKLGEELPIKPSIEGYGGLFLKAPKPGSLEIGIAATIRRDGMLGKLSLKMKMAAGFGSLLLMMAALGVVNYIATLRFSDSFARAEATAESDKTAALAEFAIEKQTAAVRGYLLYGREDMLERNEEGRKELAGYIQRLVKDAETEEEKNLNLRLEETAAEYQKICDRMVALGRQGKTREAIALGLSPAMGEARDNLRKAAADLFPLQAKQQQQAMEEQKTLESRIRTVSGALVLAGIVFGLLVAAAISRSIISTITRMVSLIQEIASNNLGADDMKINSQDEIGRAGTALNAMKNNLRDIIQSIAGTAEHVASASEEISSSATQQAQGAETQKDQTTQVATAMQEMSSTVQQVSENSNRAAEAARQASETARHGGKIVDETLAKMRAIAESVSNTARKMEELGKSSDQIGRIIGVIDDIADQTNLLALNAAIEAARAGEQGRGFAVVADEVRKLAERTTTATKEIAQMIKNIQDETKTAVRAMEEGNKQVEAGVESTAQAGDALKEIIQMAEQVGEMITHIATAATEQSSATEQVNGNMDQIARLVKESAVGAQQSAKACQDLSNLALDLQNMVSRFQLGAATTVRGASSRRSAAGSSGRAQIPALEEAGPLSMAASAGNLR
jgi:methyl-accepting chemotaxis protein